MRASEILALPEMQLSILFCLGEGGESYGLEIAARREIPRGSIYVGLQRLEALELVTSRLEVRRPGEGAARRFWRLSSRGELLLRVMERARASWLEGLKQISESE